MKLQRRVILPVSLVVMGLVAAAAFYFYKPIYRFPHLEGPAAASLLATPRGTSAADFGGSADSRLAVLVTDPSSDWLGLAHGLKSIGIPFTVTKDTTLALKHKLVVVYPAISGKLLAKDALRALAAHPHNGGTVLAFEVLGGGLDELFGFDAMTTARSRKALHFDDAERRELAFDAPEEREIPIARTEGETGSYAFRASSGKPIAHYDDGGVAIIRRDFGKGRTYVVGVDVGAYLAKAYNGRQGVGRHYANGYEPAVDVWLRWLLRVYQDAEPLAVTLDTVPYGHAASVIMSHDVDYTRSIENAIRYAGYEREQGVHASYFIQTKYVRDWNDDIFFNANGAALTKQLAGMGMEVASHSVSHSQMFAELPIGSGKESYPGYVPFVRSAADTSNATILGELRVSRFLLENAVPGLQVQSFRPGHLKYPFGLPQALQATGYRFSSSVTSGTALTHLPFRLNHDRANRTQTPVFEFPITVEDEAQRPMTARLDAATAILARLARYGGMCVVLIHPDVFDDKFEFLKGFIARAKQMDAWFGSLAEFGQWWAARDATTVDVNSENGHAVVTLELPPGSDGLSLNVPSGWSLAQVPALGRAMQRGRHVTLTGMAGHVELAFLRTR